MDRATPLFLGNKAYISLSSLPEFQRETFEKWLHFNHLEAIDLADIKLTDCVAYREYERWYTYHYTTADRII